MTGTTIRVSEDTRDRLRERGDKGDTYDDVIRAIAGWDDDA